MTLDNLPVIIIPPKATGRIRKFPRPLTTPPLNSMNSDRVIMSRIMMVAAVVDPGRSRSPMIRQKKANEIFRQRYRIAKTWNQVGSSVPTKLLSLNW